MLPRERVSEIFAHGEPDGVAIDFGVPACSIHIDEYLKLCKFLGIEKRREDVPLGIDDIVLDIDETILKRFGVDFVRVHLKKPYGWDKILNEEGEFKDEWGVTWKFKGGRIYVVKHPLEDKSIEYIDLEEYPWPNPYDPGRVEGLEDEAKRLYHYTDYAIVADAVWIGIWETAWVLRGMRRFMVDLLKSPEFVNALLGKIVDVHKRIWDAYLGAVGKYVHVVSFLDDLGWQSGPWFSPAIYRRYIKDRHHELFTFIKERTDAKILHHCCGSIYSLIPDLIEAGIDILNPIQTSAKDMGDTRRLKEEFGDKLVFWGGIDYQRVLSMKSPTEVEEEVKKRIGDLGPYYVVSSSHSLHSDVPAENIVALYNAAQKYRRCFTK